MLFGRVSGARDIQLRVWSLRWLYMPQVTHQAGLLTCFSSQPPDTRAHALSTPSRPAPSTHTTINQTTNNRLGIEEPSWEELYGNGVGEEGNPFDEFFCKPGDDDEAYASLGAVGDVSVCFGGGGGLWWWSCLN